MLQTSDGMQLSLSYTVGINIFYVLERGRPTPPQSHGNDPMLPFQATWI